MKLEEWERKTFRIQAVQVTEEDMEEIAAWCDGRIYIKKDEGEDPAFYIQFTAIHHKQKQTMKAFVGDWITWSGSSFHHYKDSSFRKGYQLRGDLESRIAEEIQNRIMEAYGFDGLGVANLATANIMELIKGE